MAPKTPYHSTTVGGADPENFVVPAGTYVISTPTAAASTEYQGGANQPDPAATTTAGTGMTLQVTVNGSNTVTNVQILNAGKDYDFGNVLQNSSGGIWAARWKWLC